MRFPERIGPYQVVRPLGRGAMGQVLEVRHPEMARPLALKLLPGLFADDEGRARFTREAQLLARVRHRNVLPVHDTGDSPDGPWLVMELIEGADLRAISDGKPLPGREAARVVAELAEGVAALHALGIIHRDLKPANVLLRPEGTPVIIDFGLARAGDVERLTRTGDFLGTPAYMAPEQATGKPEPRSDVYALGAILYHLLTGRAPFVAGSPVAVFKALLHEPPAEPAALGIEVDPALWDVCRRALDKDPERRPPSAAALRDELRRWLASARGARGAGLRGRLPLLAAALGALALAGGGVVWSLRRPRGAETGFVTGSQGEAPALTVAPVATLTWDASVRVVVSVRGSGALELLLPGQPLPERVRGGEELARELPLAEGPNVLELRLGDESGREASVRIEVERLQAPAWLQDRARPRPSPPLPPGISPGDHTGVFVHRGPLGEHELVWIPGGKLVAEPDESGEVDATVAGYFLGRTEATREQYLRFCQAGGAPPPPLSRETGPPRPEHPVTGVTWEEARRYCEAAGLRLPTLAEWLFAARGEERRPYPWGRSPPQPGGEPRANLPEGDAYPGLMPVGELEAGSSPEGVRDLCGNVAEWSADSRSELTLQGGWAVMGSGWRRANDQTLEMFARSRRMLEPHPRTDWIGFRVACDAR